MQERGGSAYKNNNTDRDLKIFWLTFEYMKSFMLFRKLLEK